ncbi:hypothetical protein HOLleu_24980 [Holothuria leucospilota]|uniref:Ig-like domain-containing protein n=1 Tax=Holothuria leucospilota TaxID=206669 RepID=A0A9Q1BS74_HOLLE|nr:hypothetical protein HOLleu_24980 [Holothuria leucospilota]
MESKGMGKVMLLNWVAFIICLSVRESCSACVEGMDEIVEGVLGDNANISCKASSLCNHILWHRKYNRSTMDSSQETTNQTSSHGLQIASFHTFSPLTSDDFGVHSCWCYNNGQKSDSSPVCTVTLTPICQSKVKINGKTTLYNSSKKSSSLPKFLDVTEGDKVKVKCPEYANASTNCRKVKDVSRKDGSHYDYKLTTSLRHNLCSIVCNLKHKNRQICVNITLHVSKLTKTTQTPTGPTKFPVALLLSILAVFLVTISFAFLFCKFFLRKVLRSRFNSQSNKQMRPCYPSSSSSHLRDQNIETINLSSKTFLQEHTNVLEQEACDNDGFYYEIEDTKDCHDIIDTKDSLHQPANLLTTETSISHDFNFATQTSKEKDVENYEPRRCDELYFEATNEDRVKGEKECGPINEAGDQPRTTSSSSGKGASQLEVFYAVLENGQDC